MFASEFTREICVVRRVTTKRIISTNKWEREGECLCMEQEHTKATYCFSMHLSVYSASSSSSECFFFRFENKQEQQHISRRLHDSWGGVNALWKLFFVLACIKMCSNVQAWRKKKHTRTHTTMEFYEIFMVEMVKWFCCFFSPSSSSSSHFLSSFSSMHLVFEWFFRKCISSGDQRMKWVSGREERESM